MNAWNRKTLVAAGAVFVFTTAAVSLCRYANSADLKAVSNGLDALVGMLDESDRSEPIDYGQGPGVAPKADTKSTAAIAATVVPTGKPNARLVGEFGAPVSWPIIQIHAVLLPDGRVMTYGTNVGGTHGGKLVYDIWDPILGTGTDSHLVLSNTTGGDIFCGAQSVMTSGAVLLSGGNLVIDRVSGSALNDTSIFSPITNTLAANTPMSFARWYGSLVALSNGQLVIFGGRENVGVLSPAISATTPELYDPATQTWTELTGAVSAAAFGGVEWWYPKSQEAPGGNVFVLSTNGTLYSVSTAGTGSITQYAVKASPTYHSLPAVPFAPGMLLSLSSKDRGVEVIDYSGPVPVVTPTDDIDQLRLWSTGTVLADGTVLVTGGSTVANELTGVAYSAQIWNPATGHWTTGASAAIPRLYHSNALLLTDGSVLTGGGGAPGPVANLNAEIYYPPYLYGANGVPAIRPVMTAASLNSEGSLDITVDAGQTISKVTFVRTGSSTHSNNSDQRFLNLAFTQVGQNVTATVPSDPTVVVPGYYMLFVFNSKGIPSVATIINIG